MAGLPGFGAMVSVEPPLSCNGPSCGSPEVRFWPLLLLIVPLISGSVGALFPATMELVRFKVPPRFQTPPATPVVAVLPDTVDWIRSSVPEKTKIAPPLPVAVLSVKVELMMSTSPTTETAPPSRPEVLP